MGFEQKFVRGLNDRNWTKPLLAFVNPQNIQASQFVAELVEKAICADWRDGAFPGFTRITQAYQWARGQLGDAAQLQFYITGSNETEILSSFQAACGPLLDEVGNHPQAERLVDLAFDHLSNACRDNSLYNQSHQVATEVLVDDFLRHHAAAKLEPALPVCINRHRHSPERVQARHDAVVGALRLDRVVRDIVIGKEKLRAPRTQREKVSLGMSLLR